MVNPKKIVFLTGTRADFGKLKSLIEITSQNKKFEVHIFVTGMHMNPKYGRTVHEILNLGYKNIFTHYNHNDFDSMDIILSKTIEGFINFVNDIKPDLIVVHGDRVEALAGAIVGALNNILTAHIEGGEVSGTVDELIRHSVSKLSHLHFVSNKTAKKRLIQMGELPASIYEIGSPDIDIMLSNKLPDISEVKRYYEINYENYGIVLFHPVATELEEIKKHTNNLVEAIIESSDNYVVIYPNNDKGSDKIFDEYEKFIDNEKIRYLPSLRFEYFLTLLKNARFIIGNSSSGIIEAPYYGVPSINIGSRQNNRVKNKDIIHCGYSKKEIQSAILEVSKIRGRKVKKLFGKGDSDKRFLKIVLNNKIWETSKQKRFQDMV